MLREPFVAGRFYPGERGELTGEIGKHLSAAARKQSFLGALVPHAGYEFSGGTAGKVYSGVELPPAVVVLGPKHNPAGAPGAVWAAGAWRTPLGALGINESLARGIIGRCGLLEEDYEAHLREHSIEVQVPFLQYLNPAVNFVPVALAVFSLEECVEIAEGLAAALEEYGGGVPILASSDMTHFEPESSAAARDRMAIEAMKALDERALYEVVRRESISMCGFIPAAVMIAAVKRMGAVSAEVSGYSTSAAATGDYSRVVGYCGMVFR